MGRGPRPPLRLTPRGWVVLVVLPAAIFGFATGDWTWYDYIP